MQEKQDKHLPEPLLDVEYLILSFIKPKKLGPIRLVDRRFNFLSEDQFQSTRLLDYIDKGKLDEAKVLLKSYPDILKHVEYQKRFINSCLEEGKVENIKLLLEHRLDFLLNKKYEQLMGSYLLKYGVKANQDAAELLIKKNPNLLLFKGDVVDDSGRYFKNVSFLQVITWCLDVLYMGNMVYESLPKDKEGEQIRKELSQQLDEHLSHGLNFELKIGDYLPKTERGQEQKNKLISGFKKLIELKYLNYEFKEGSNDTLIIKNETHFDLTPLAKAHQLYATNYGTWSKSQCLEFWCTVVGLLQTLLSLYMRQHYCEKDARFIPTPKFDTKQFNRCLDFNNDVTKSEKLLDCSALGLGLDYAMIPGHAYAECGSDAQYLPIYSKAFSALFERRSKQDSSSLLKTFKQPLIQIEQTLEFSI